MRPDQRHKGTASICANIEIRPVDREDLAALSRLTTQNLRSQLANPEGGPDNCNLVAWIENVPAGLLLSRRSLDRFGTQELLSLMVTPLFRRQGLARALLAELEITMASAGRTHLLASWSDRLPQLESFRALLSREGWDIPEPARLRMSFNVGERQDALRTFRPLMASARRHGLSSRPMAAMPDEPRNLMLAAATTFARAGAMPAWANPAPWLEHCDPAVSQLLFDENGRLCGWLLGEYQPGFTRWSVPLGWCSTDASHMLLAMDHLLCDLEHHGGPGATLILQPSQRNGHRVCTLLDRHFRPYALWADHLVSSSKTINQA
ncbi:GNAT family N-acetyltransferase [Pannonibacter carbonis]|uniref:GNAT family N-acetyltransferase n=1 Tax=Pannonibacter carbonis TaxID=2067569 RepID=UPI000D1018C6|nr:GNAT family N-acetyltransferase [Pannonibacter carbonis]